jgi:hypothetical protein
VGRNSSKMLSKNLQKLSKNKFLARIFGYRNMLKLPNVELNNFHCWLNFVMAIQSRRADFGLGA